MIIELAKFLTKVWENINALRDNKLIYKKDLFYPFEKCFVK